MKKIMLAIALVLSLTAVSFAQTKPEVTKKAKPSKAAAVKPATAPTASPAASSSMATSRNAAPVKKDGTPDKRYKANKDNTVVHKKKDGTADMRFKENKSKKKN